MNEHKQVGFWKNIFIILNFQEHNFTAKQGIIALIAYSTVSFFIPLVFKHPQLLVGAVVNAMLILTALNLQGKKILPMIILPSIAAALGGYLFGGFTVYLIYLIPFIWIGNMLIVFAFKYFRLQQKKNYFITLGIGSLAKAGFLFGITYIFVTLSIIPTIFLTAMGIIQLATALTGGIFAFAIQNAKNYF